MIKFLVVFGGDILCVLWMRHPVDVFFFFLIVVFSAIFSRKNE